MDWIHCNNCASQIGDEEDRKFVTTNCGHIYCEHCILLPELKQCRICQSSYQTMPLSPNMSKEVKIYFRNPIGDIQKLLKVLEFQQSHRMRLTTINRDKIKTYARLEKENLFLKEEFKRLEKENAHLKEENKRLNDLVYEYKRKIDCLTDRQKICHTPIHPTAHTSNTSHNAYDVFRTKTPKFIKPENAVISSENHCTVLKQPVEKPNFFLMSSTKNVHRDVNPFNSPTLSKLSGSYRSMRTLASGVSSPASPKPSFREILSQKDQNYKRVKLPGDKGSLQSTLAFRRYALSKLTSVTKNDGPASTKYSHYFNK